MSDFHDEYTDLLGAYALDAVEPDEHRRIEAHLHTCPWCAAEVAESRELAAFLSHTGTDAPEGVWDRIVAELSPPAPPLRMSFSPAGELDPLTGPGSDEPAAPPSKVVPLPSRSIRTRTVVAVLGAAAVLLAALGFVAVDQSRRADKVRDDVASGTIPQSAGDVSVKLTGDDDDAGARAVINPSGKGYLVANDLPDPGRERLYQLWGRVDGVVLSLGTFDSETDVVNFQLDPSQLDAMEAFAVTEEQVPGVLASDHGPVLAGDVA